MKSRYTVVVFLGVLVALTVAPAIVAAQPDVTGQWSSLPPMPSVPIHTHLLPTGQVMYWGAGIPSALWDPVTHSVSSTGQPDYELFCSGHALLADGQLFVAGGHIENNVGLARASTYDASSGSWKYKPNMNAGRWYPTTTVLGNGDVLVVSGDIDTAVGVNKLPQVFQVETGTWRDLTSAQLALDLYPFMFLAPNGKVFHAGPGSKTRYLDVSGTGTWTFVADRVGEYRDYGSGVMYADGKVLVMGGSTDPPANSAEVIDLNQASPTWRAVAPMQFRRRQLNALILPDGKVLVTGGTSGPGFDDPTSPVFPAELWDPATETWTTLASASVPRLYHSGTVLLPDGRVLSTGGNGYTHAEVFSPPYLFKGSRPSIASAPAVVRYGQPFFVGTSDAPGVTKVTMLRLSSTTHALNMNQRFSQLAFSQATGGLNVTPPLTANSAPPGHYLLFLLNGNGVPSVAKIVQLTATAPANTAPTISNITDRAVNQNTGTGAIAFTVGDGETPAGNLVVTGASSNGTLVPPGNIVFGGSEAARTVTVTPAANQVGDATITVTVSDGTLTARDTFMLTVHAALSTLTVSRVGQGTGTVTSLPAGINCGGDCSESYPSGTTVTLTATPNQNSRFVRWQGACTGTGACTVTLNAATAVTARFGR
jgi:hypothetical protein